MTDTVFRPYTPRNEPSKRGALNLVLAARRNFLEVFSNTSYEQRFLRTKIFRQQVLIVNSPDLIKELLVNKHENFERKSPQMRRGLEHLLGDGLFISDGPLWALRRPLVAPIIHQKKLSIFADTMVDAATGFTQELSKLSEAEYVDMVDVSARMTATIICRTIFGRDLNPAYARKIVDGFAVYQKRADMINLGYFFGAKSGLPIYKGLALRKAKRGVQGSIRKVLAQAEQDFKKGNSGSMIEQLLSADIGDGKKLSKQAIINEAATLFMAGYETTASTLAWAHYLLANCPRSEARFLSEIDTVLNGKPPSYEDVANLPFTRAIVDETLRLYPPVPILMRQARNEDEIAGQPIPAGSLAGAVPWLLHRNKKLWQDPDAFLPERFVDARIDPFAYMPFARGPRICAGAAFGLTEAILCLAVFGQKYQFRMKQGWEVKPLQYMTLKPHNGLPMRIIKR